MHRPAAATIILLLPIANIHDLIRIDARGTTTAFDSRAGVARPLAGLAQKQEPGCSGGEPNPPVWKQPIPPIFIADSGSLAVSREKDGKPRAVYAGWDDRRSSSRARSWNIGQARDGS